MSGRQLPQTAGVAAPNRSISVVIPTLNEAAELPETLRQLRLVPEVTEIIIADGGSQDATMSLARAAGCQVVASPPGRGRPMWTEKNELNWGGHRRSTVVSEHVRRERL